MGVQAGGTGRGTLEFLETLRKYWIFFEKKCSILFQANVLDFGFEKKDIRAYLRELCRGHPAVYQTDPHQFRHMFDRESRS